MVNKNLYTLLVCLLLAGCDLIDYHPYDVRISGETDVNAHNIEQIEAKCKGKTTIRFITMGDSQRWYDETEDFVKEVNKRDDIDFVIHGGDMSDFGLTKEFLWQRDIMNGLKVPYVVLIGNHDCLGTGAETYQAVFGPTNFSFIAGNVKFVCSSTSLMDRWSGIVCQPSIQLSLICLNYFVHSGSIQGSQKFIQIFHGFFLAPTKPVLQNRSIL